MPICATFINMYLHCHMHTYCYLFLLSLILLECDVTHEMESIYNLIANIVV